ncbi:hypothetical protein EDC01DRAFT_708896 [Geopyxis carbonaria]|nr:hypothetical protein EDC01DRAFT_708896 [Geopyxis carbonaria]
MPSTKTLIAATAAIQAIKASPSLAPRLYLPGDAVYTAEQATYWSTRSGEVQPAATVVPQTAEEAAEAVALLLSSSTPFAIKSGGHSPTPRTNTTRGILLSLSALSNTTYDPATTHAHLGPGARWGSVYAALQPHNRTAIGARYSEVGVGGFLLGGGLSHLSGAHGLGSRSIVSLLVVTGRGSVTASASENAELFWALTNGGGNEFGIVTQFTVRTYPSTSVWGGMHVTLDIPAVLDALDEPSVDADADAAVMPSFVFGTGTGLPPDETMASLMLYHGTYRTPVPSQTALDSPAPAPPPSLAAFAAAVPLHSTLRQTTHGDLAAELAAGNNCVHRHAFVTGSQAWRYGAAMRLYEAAMGVLRGGNAEALFCVAFTLQLVDVGGKDETAWWWLLSVEYVDAEEDATVQRLCQDVVEVLRNMEGSREFLFRNDAGDGQDVLAGCDAATRVRFQAVKSVWDPEGRWAACTGTGSR